jgi:hypothetical protein
MADGKQQKTSSPLVERMKSAGETIYDVIGGRSTEEAVRQAVARKKKPLPKGRASGRR